MSAFKVILGIIGCVGIAYLLPQVISAWRALRNYHTNHYGGGLGGLVLDINFFAPLIGSVICVALIILSGLEIAKLISNQ